MSFLSCDTTTYVCDTCGYSNSDDIMPDNCDICHSLEDAREVARFWERRAREHEAGERYYQDELEKAHALLGRLLQQLSERWDTVNLTKYFPTSNLHRKRTVSNPSGEPT